MHNYLYRFTKLMFGLFLYAFGMYFCLQANVGLAAWDAFNTGLSYVSGLSIGTIVSSSGILIIGIDFLLGEKIGFGSICNAVLIGIFIDFIYIFDPIPELSSFPLGILLLLLGIVTIGFASYLYISVGMGCGPRDALMVAINRRIPSISIGATRTMIEATVLFLGWLMGAKIGFGTIIAVSCMGYTMQCVFKLFKFDIKSICHENILDTLHNFSGNTAEKSA